LSGRGLIYIVAADKSSRDLLRKILEKEDYAVALNTDAEDPATHIASVQPDLILLDTHLPDADPFTLLAHLKRGSGTRDIPVIFLTTPDDVETRLKGLESGDDLLVRPFDTREVLARIERQVTVSKVRMALRESEAKFRSVMESAIDAIISGDAEGRIRSWNSAATALFGFTEAEALGQPIEIIIPQRYRDSHREGMHRVTSGGPSHVIGKTVELAAIRKDGSEFPVELSLATWFLDDVRYYTGIIRDISERKQAEAKFRSVTESAIDAIISADHKGCIISWNKAATRILGYEEDEVLGKQLEIIIPKRYHQAHQQGMDRFTRTGEAHVIGTTVELSACTKGGEEVPIELSLSTWTVRDERYYTGIIRDIAERKAAEEALRRSEQTLRERTEELRLKNDVLQQTLNQLNEMNEHLIIQEKMASLGRLSAGMAHELNNPAAAAQRGAAQLQAMFARWRDMQLEIAELQLGEDQLQRLNSLDRIANDRARRPAELSAVARSDLESSLEEWLQDQGVASLVEFVPALVSLGVDRSALELLSSGFTANQLAVILSWLSLKFEIYSLVGEISLGTERIVDLVKALKTYTYMDQAPVQSVDLREGLDNTLVILQNKIKKGVRVQKEYDADLPVIEAYASELNQVWTNLIDNAIDAMQGEGTLTLRTRWEDPWVVVEVEDDGPGIPEPDQSLIFDPFFTTKPPGEGTGLGLNISRNLVVKKHRGEISVDSRPGCTCFHVRLPTKLWPEGVQEKKE
jgi:PAS domain S-box-containing protein